MVPQTSPLLSQACDTFKPWLAFSGRPILSSAVRRGHNFIGEAVTLSLGELWGWAGSGTGAYKLQVKLFKDCQLKQIHSANLKLFTLKRQAIYSVLEEK